jgi:hypothetical protein
MKQELHEMFVADQFLIPSTAELGVTKRKPLVLYWLPGFWLLEQDSNL